MAGTKKVKKDRSKMLADSTRAGKISAAKQRGTKDGVARFSKSFREYLKGGWSR